MERFREGMKEENFGPTRWHECVCEVIGSCLKETKCTKKDLYEAAASMPFLVDVGGALSDVNACKMEKKCGQAIISDGNDLFITAFLKKNGMDDYFTHGIETNTGIWESGNGNHEASTNDNAIGDKGKEDKLKIIYQSDGHSCKTCPPNLCKSQSLQDILDRIEQCTGDNKCRPRIVYIGDGSNDTCPALHVLTENDILLARCGRRRRDPNSLSGPTTDEDSTEGHGQHNFHPEMHVGEVESHVAGAFPILSVLRKAKLKEGLEPKCAVCVWRSGRQLRSTIQHILDGTLNRKNAE